MKACPYVLANDCGYRDAPEPDAFLCLCRHDKGEWADDRTFQQIDRLVDRMPPPFFPGDEEKQ